MAKYLTHENGMKRLIEFPNFQATQPILSVSASKSFSLSDAGTLQLCANTSAINLTVPSDSTVAFPVGSLIEITQDSTGSVTIVSATGVEIKRQGSTAITNHVLLGQYALVQLKKISANSWRAYGGLAW